MKTPGYDKWNMNKLQSRFIWLILALGVIIRVVVFLQNRNLIIDEANVARNIYERGYAALALPLDYEQFAPPVFLWILKLCTSVLGYSEYALRFYSLLAGIAALFLMHAVLKQITNRSFWYPLLLMATAYIFIRYSSEVKQYMSDAMVTLALMLLALRLHVNESKAGSFIFTWLLAGTLAIWLSMPSVFTLAGVGVYYLLRCTAQKNYKKIGVLAVVGVLWLAQFLIYYFTVLKPQINSDYLQNFHRNQFFHFKDAAHDWELFSQLFTVPAGHTAIAMVFNIALFFIGAIILLIHDKAKASLLLIPFTGLIVAAMLHQYALVPRLILFILPVVLSVIGYGFEMIMTVKQKPLRFVFISVALLCVINNLLHTIRYDSEKESITDALIFVQEKGIADSQLYLHHGAIPTFIYYTSVHPKSGRFRNLMNANCLAWDANYEKISSQISKRAAFIYTSIGSDELQSKKQVLENYLQLETKQEKKGSWVYIYRK